MNKFTNIIMIAVLLLLHISDLISAPIKWGTPFMVSTTSVNVPYNCSFNNKDICCDLLVERYVSDDENQEHSFFPNTAKCTIHREYVQSPYELRQIEKALQKTNCKSYKERRIVFADFITSQEEVTASTIWLNRVKFHMGKHEHSVDNSNNAPHPDDLEYLSRFKVTKTCKSKCHSKHSNFTTLEASNACRKSPPTISTWLEWIEPLSIHGRHPFGLGLCSNPDLEVMFLKRQNFTGTVKIFDTDYLLIQSREAFLGDAPFNDKNITVIHSSEQHSNNENNKHHHPQQQQLQAHAPPPPTSSSSSPTIRTFLFDVGTSTFSSSLIYFSCAYAQRQLHMDSIHAWESMLLEPINFWSEIPSEISSRYHYYNIPVSANLTHKDSVLRIIQKITKVEDFVSLKLDIDTPEVELAIVNDILKYPQLANLIDEFYFELHYQCELLANCWGYDKSMMDHHSGMQLFVKLRKLGIRAHFWV